MACSTAVVASRVGGIPEVVDAGVTGLLVPPDDPASLADALNMLLRDPGRGDAMGLAARAGRDGVLLGRGRGADRGAVRGTGRRHLTAGPVRFALLAVIGIWIWWG